MKERKDNRQNDGLSTGENRIGWWCYSIEYWENYAKKQENKNTQRRGGKGQGTEGEEKWR